MNSFKILIVRLSALGDVVQTLPSLTLLNKFLPLAEIDWVVDERNAEILRGHPFLRRILVFSSKYLKSLKNLKNFLRELRREDYEVIIDYQGLLKSGLIVWLSKGKYKIGFSNHREGSSYFYNFKLPPYDINLHAVKRYLILTKEVLKLFNFENLEEIGEIPEAVFPEVSFPEFLNPNQFYVSLIPKGRWETKNWALEKWEQLIHLLMKEKQINLLILGSPEDLALKRWAKKLENSYPSLKSLVGQIKLSQVIAVLKFSKLVVTVDTGPMHIASALKVPTVALFGPTSPERTGPWGKNYIVIKSSISCSPCFKKNCSTKECMERISPYQVREAIEKLLF